MRSGESGVAFLLLLVTLAVITVAAAGSLRLGHDMERRAAEQELLAVGLDWDAALASWRHGDSQGPAELTDLLRDPRVPGLRRHLRQIPFDPLTGRAEWGVVRDPRGGIAGVYSLAQGTPIKTSGFDPSFQRGYENAKSYAAWVFGLSPLFR